jgi:hypothetical protein
MKAKGVDLNSVLESWKYDEEDNVRRVTTDGGREVLQVRLPLGVEQYELEGRPDGSRPNDCESWYHYFDESAKREPWSFSLAEDDFEKIKDECLLYYYRYLLFFQIQDYSHCARDTLRNLEVLDFVSRHTEDERSTSLEQYRPYILRMHLMARALDEVKNGVDVEEAITMIESGLAQINELPDLDGNKVFDHEKRTSLKVLGQLHEQLKGMLPPDPDSDLKRRLEDAVRSENYEEAARLRDRLSGDLDDGLV